jgi:energy-coupling factor transporter transmembrane protein EcfT
MSIFAQVTNPIRLFPPALIFVILCAVFFAKIDKKKYLIPIIIFIILINLGASGIMANWLLFNDDSIFDPKKDILHQELYNISQILSKEENIESKYLMGNNQFVAYHANSKFIRDYTFDGPTGKIHEENLDLERHILKKDLDAYQIYVSKFYSYPISEFDLERIPDYLLIKPVKNIPEDWKILYESENYILLKMSG